MKTEPEFEEEDFENLMYDELSDDEDLNADAFRIDGALDPPEHKTYTAQELHEQIHEGIIDLNPPYQREVVWPVSKQISLIDSLWKNYHVPSIVFVSRTDSDGDEILICVDGKQRLTSIHKFLDGQIPHKVGKKSWWFTLPDKNKANNFEIPSKWKEIFHAKDIVCDVYRDVSEESERQMFHRVQKGMPLTPAEKLQAIASNLNVWITNLNEQHVKIDDGLAQVLAWDTTRSKSYLNILQMVYCCDGYPTEERVTFGSVEKWLENGSDPAPHFKADMDKVLVDFWKIASDRKLNYPFTRSQYRVAPVEFVFTGVLLYAIRHHDLKTKASAIDNMRKAVRSTHVDVRTNNKVSRSLWTYVKLLQRHPLRAISVKNPIADRPSASTASRTAKKRKAKHGDDDDDDYRG